MTFKIGDKVKIKGEYTVVNPSYMNTKAVSIAMSDGRETLFRDGELEFIGSSIKRTYEITCTESQYEKIKQEILDK